MIQILKLTDPNFDKIIAFLSDFKRGLIFIYSILTIQIIMNISNMTVSYCIIIVEISFDIYEYE